MEKLKGAMKMCLLFFNGACDDLIFMRLFWSMYGTNRISLGNERRAAIKTLFKKCLENVVFVMAICMTILFFSFVLIACSNQAACEMLIKYETFVYTSVSISMVLAFVLSLIISMYSEIESAYDYALRSQKHLSNLIKEYNMNIEAEICFRQYASLMDNIFGYSISESYLTACENMLPLFKNHTKYIPALVCDVRDDMKLLQMADKLFEFEQKHHENPVKSFDEYLTVIRETIRALDPLNDNRETLIKIYNQCVRQTQALRNKRYMIKRCELKEDVAYFW